jgi:hypothetical protein
VSFERSHAAFQVRKRHSEVEVSGRHVSARSTAHCPRWANKGRLKLNVLVAPKAISAALFVKCGRLESLVVRLSMGGVGSGTELARFAARLNA